MKFKLLHFPNKVGYRAGNMQADISQNVFLPDEDKTAKFGPGMEINSCGHVVIN